MRSIRPGLDWISAVRSSAIRRLVESGAVQMSLFDQTDLVEIRSEAYPGERLMVCRNPLLQAERARKREELLRAANVCRTPSRPAPSATSGPSRAGTFSSAWIMTLQTRDSTACPNAYDISTLAKTGS